MAEDFHCDKAPEIQALTKEIRELKKFVLIGNGQKSMSQLLTETRDMVYPLATQVDLMTSNVVALIKFQNQTEAARQVKEDMRARKRSRERWAIGILLTFTLGTGSILAIVLT